MTVNTWRWSSPGETAPVWPGSHQVLGATWTPEATNFAVHSPEATSMWVCIFDDEDRLVRSNGLGNDKTPGSRPGVPVPFGSGD